MITFPYFLCFLNFRSFPQFTDPFSSFPLDLSMASSTGRDQNSSYYDPPPSLRDRIHGRIAQFHVWLGDFYYRNTLFLLKHSFLASLLCLILAIALGMGTTNLKREERWQREDSRAYREKLLFKENFKSPSTELLIIESRHPSTSSLIDKANLQALMNLHERILLVRSSASTGSKNYEEICPRAVNGNCDILSLLDYFNYNSTYLDSLTQTEITDLISDEAPSSGHKGEPLILSTFASGITRDSNNKVTKISAAMSLYGAMFIDFEKGEPEKEALLKSWESGFLDVCAQVDSTSTAIRVHREAIFSFGIEIDKVISQDTVLFVIAYLLMFTFVGVFTSTRCDCYRSRILLSLGTIFSVILALLCAFGFEGLVGVGFPSISAIIPFIAVAVGVDDAFIIIHRYDFLTKIDRKRRLKNLKLQANNPKAQLYRVRTANERVAQSVKDVATSITLTSLTDVAAFAMGATTIIPAVSQFATFAVFTMIFNFFFVVTGFLLVLGYDARRQEAFRCDVLPCVVLSKPKE